MENDKRFKPNPKLKLMDQVREVLKYYHYAYSTEQSYCKWVLQFIRFYENKVKGSSPLLAWLIGRDSAVTLWYALFA